MFGAMSASEHQAGSHSESSGTLDLGWRVVLRSRRRHDDRAPDGVNRADGVSALSRRVSARELAELTPTADDVASESPHARSWSAT